MMGVPPCCNRFGVQVAAPCVCDDSFSSGLVLKAFRLPWHSQPAWNLMLVVPSLDHGFETLTSRLAHASFSLNDVLLLFLRST